MHFDNNCLSALSRLYDAENGLPFDALALDDEHFLMLLDAGLIDEPDGFVFRHWGGKDVSHAGVVRLTVKGRASVEELRKAEAEREQEDAVKKAAEAQRLAERADDRAAEERHHAAQNKIAIIMPLVTFLLGLLVANLAQIIGFLSSLLR